VFLQNASSEEHGPLSRIRDDTKGWGKHGVGLAGTARAWCVALGWSRHTGFISHKGPSKAPALQNPFFCWFNGKTTDPFPARAWASALGQTCRWQCQCCGSAHCRSREASRTGAWSCTDQGTQPQQGFRNRAL